MENKVQDSGNLNIKLEIEEENQNVNGKVISYNEIIAESKIIKSEPEDLPIYLTSKCYVCEKDVENLAKMEFGMGVEESEMYPRDSQCNAEISAKVYLENQVKRKVDKKAKEPLAKCFQDNARFLKRKLINFKRNQRRNKLKKLR